MQINASAKAWLILIFLSLIWGSSFILIKKSLIAFAPEQVGAARIVIAFLAFLPLFIKKYKDIDWSLLMPLLVVGLCGSAFPAFLYATAQTHIPSAVAGVLNSLTPIFTFLIAIWFFRHRFEWSQAIGVVVGFIGVILISMTKPKGSEHFPFFYGMLIIIATICYAISANTVKKYLSGMRPLMISTISFTIVGPFMLIYLLQTGFTKDVVQHPHGWTSLAALMTLSLLGTFLANIVFFRLVQLTDAVFSSSVSYVIPFVAIFWGFLDGEALSIYHFLALALIITGVVLIKFTKAS